MKRFRFSLATVLRVKRQVEEQRQRELAKAQGERDRVLAWLASTEESLKSLNAEQLGYRQGKLDLAAETWFQGRHLELSEGIRQGRLTLLQKEELLDAARTVAVEAARERKVLEKLEEQQRLEHQLKSNREEQGFMDELAQHAASQLAYSSPSANGR